MQSLPPALFIVLLELTAGAFLTLYLLDWRGGTSRGYVIFQGALYFVLALLTYGAMQSFAMPALLHGFGLDAGWLAWQPPLVVAFLLLLIPWNILLWLDPTAPRKKGVWAAAKAEADLTPQPSPLRGEGGPETGAQAAVRRSGAGPETDVARERSAPGWMVPARHVVGALTALVGMAAVFAVGMAYRPLADARLGGFFVVAAFVAGAVALGGVTTAMLLGHWYLNTPTASGKPLEFSTIVLLGGLVAALAFLLLAGPSTAHPVAGSTVIAPGTTINTSGNTLVITTPTAVPTKPGQKPPTVAATPREAPLGTDAMVWLQYLLGYLAPLALGAVSLWLVRGRSFQSATGMLYLAMAFIFIGEIISRALLVAPLFM